jgi:phospholipid transport system transporter-binding protein
MSEAAGIESGANGTARLFGDLTFATVRALSQQGDAVLKAGNPPARIDLRDVRRVDSSGLALLLEWQSRARAAGGSIAIVNAPNDLARLARLCEAEGLLQMSNQETVDTES